MLCLAPLILIGHAFTIQTPTHHTENVDGTMIEAQTCESGLGLHAKASTAGLYGLGLHYGLTGTWGDWSATISPHAGLSYADVASDAVPLKKQFELGLQVLGGYKRMRIGISYWHLSNAGLMEPNIGLDMIILQTGWTF